MSGVLKWFWNRPYGLRSPIVGEKFMSCAQLLTEGFDLILEGDWKGVGVMPRCWGREVLGQGLDLGVWASVLQGGNIFALFFIYLEKRVS